MSGNLHNENYFTKITKILKFFELNKARSGLLFCSYDYFGLVQEVNRQLIKKAKKINITIKALTMPMESPDYFLPTLRKNLFKEIAKKQNLKN